MLLFSKTLIVQLKSLDGGIILIGMSKREFCFITRLLFAKKKKKTIIQSSFSQRYSSQIWSLCFISIFRHQWIKYLLNTYSVCQVLLYIIRIHQWKKSCPQGADILVTRVLEWWVTNQIMGSEENKRTNSREVPLNNWKKGSTEKSIQHYLLAFKV